MAYRTRREAIVLRGKALSDHLVSVLIHGIHL